MSYYVKPQKERKWKIHPIWRGVGCFIIVFIPLLGYASADVFVRNVPRQWLNFLSPDAFQRIVLPYIDYTLPISLAVGLLTIFFTLLLYILLVVVYSAFYRFLGPPQYGPLDAPPIRRKTRRSR